MLFFVGDIHRIHIEREREKDIYQCIICIYHITIYILILCVLPLCLG